MPPCGCDQIPDVAQYSPRVTYLVFCTITELTHQRRLSTICDVSGANCVVLSWAHNSSVYENRVCLSSAAFLFLDICIIISNFSATLLTSYLLPSHCLFWSLAIPLQWIHLSDAHRLPNSKSHRHFTFLRFFKGYVQVQNPRYSVKYSVLGRGVFSSADNNIILGPPIVGCPWLLTQYIRSSQSSIRGQGTLSILLDWYLVCGVVCGVLSEAGVFLLVQDKQVNFVRTQLSLYLVYSSNISFYWIKCLVHLVLVRNTSIRKALAAHNAHRAPCRNLLCSLGSRVVLFRTQKQVPVVFCRDCFISYLSNS